MLNKAIIDHQEAFSNVYSIITEAQSRAWQQINKTLIELYWNIGLYVSERVTTNGWGKSIVEKLSTYITSKNPAMTGFSARNIWRMKQFYETYQGNEKLSAVLAVFSTPTKGIFKFTGLFFEFFLGYFPYQN